MFVGTGVGRLGKDPELREVNGTSVCSMRVAFDFGFGQNKGTMWVDVNVWGKQAAACNSFLEKGSSICVTGPVSEREWTDSEGNQRKQVQVRASDVKFLDPPKDTQDNAASMMDEGAF